MVDTKQAEAEFLDIYAQIRDDLLKAVATACTAKGIAATDAEVAQATHRLLDRMLFLAYCEDHPHQLLPPGTVEAAIKAARCRPGENTYKVYDELKALFREIRAGASTASDLAFAAYNGELFKPHPIVDEIDLPDALCDPVYVARSNGRNRTVRGVWGFSDFHFWHDLDESLLGRLFERFWLDAIPSHRQHRRRYGMFYTNDVVATYIVQGVIKSMLDDLPVPPRCGDAALSLQRRCDALARLRIIDPACGSGAFLIASSRVLLDEWARLREAIRAAQPSGTALSAGNGEATAAVTAPAELLRETIYGADVEPCAVERAQLALWLRSARKGERVVDLRAKIVTANSLDLDALAQKLDRKAGTFDVVVGNPPWGVPVFKDDPVTYARLLDRLGLDPPSPLDSWELFVLISFHLLREGGRLAFVLPDTLFAPKKEWIRRQIVDRSTLERVVHLGMGWFGERVRIGAVAVQARYTRPTPASMYTGVALCGKLRQDALQGRVLLPQIERDWGKACSQAAILVRPDAQILVAQGVRDDAVMATIAENSVKLSALTTWLRGEELAGDGVLWCCRECGFHTSPPDWRKERATKACPGCGAMLDRSNIAVVNAILPSPAPGAVPLVVTDDIHRRYGRVVPSKYLRADLSGWRYKDQAAFAPPKLLVREAGVGVTCGVDYTDARCVRSLYVFRMTEAASAMGYAIEYLLAALHSRTMQYYVVQATNQADPSRPFAHLRLGSVGELPIPKVDCTHPQEKRKHDEIVALVKRMLDGAPGGGLEDLRIERILRELWGLDEGDGEYIAKELAQLPPFGRLAQRNNSAAIAV